MYLIYGSKSHIKGMQPLILRVNQIFLGLFVALTSCVRCATSPVSLKGLSLTPSSSLPHSEVSMRTSQESSFRVMTTSYTGPGRRWQFCGVLGFHTLAHQKLANSINFSPTRIAAAVRVPELLIERVKSVHLGVRVLLPHLGRPRAARRIGRARGRRGGRVAAGLLRGGRGLQLPLHGLGPVLRHRRLPNPL